MTPTADSPLRIVTFGDIDAGVWGAVWTAPVPTFAAGSLDRSRTGPAKLDASEENGDWRIAGDGLELRISPAADQVHNTSLDGYDQLGRVSGRIETSDGESAVEGLCRRAVRIGVDLGTLGSLRDVSSWYGPDQGLALTAVRPRKTKGHDRDLIAAAVLDAGGEHEVADPRLSTTYAAGGVPARAGLELWLEGEEETEQYPRRAAGEAAAPGARSEANGIEVLAEPFRWHSRGEHGSGVYLLMRPR